MLMSDRSAVTDASLSLSRLVSLSYFGSVDPAIYGIKARPLGENERTSGSVIVSATNLSGQFLADPQSYRWLLQQERTEILDHSLYVFHVREK